MFEDRTVSPDLPDAQLSVNSLIKSTQASGRQQMSDVDLFDDSNSSTDEARATVTVCFVIF